MSDANVLQNEVPGSHSEPSPVPCLIGRHERGGQLVQRDQDNRDPFVQPLFVALTLSYPPVPKFIAALLTTENHREGEGHRRTYDGADQCCKKNTEEPIPRIIERTHDLVELLAQNRISITRHAANLATTRCRRPRLQPYARSLHQVSGAV